MSSRTSQLVLLACWTPLIRARSGLLHPQDSESREVKDLGGLWRFRADKDGTGLRDHWYRDGLPSPTIAMAVPSSYNELTQEWALREHVGIVWYQRDFFVPLHWMTRRVVLYIGSANHHAILWLNGQRVGEHEGGHLPFHVPLAPTVCSFGKSNRLVIALNNTLSTTTIPPGFTQVRPHPGTPTTHASATGRTTNTLSG